MNLKEEIALSYLDGYKLVAPNIVPPGTMRSCDNGTLFRSEYDIMLQKLGQSTDADKNTWEYIIGNCMEKPGLTVRAPGDTAIDAPDNIYGILAAAKVLGRPLRAQQMLSYGLRHFGFYNPTGTFNWGALQWRQPQMLFAMLCASNKAKWYKIWQHPLSIITALIIATSCKGVQTGDTDSRLLSWLLIQTVKEDSLLCRLASKLWYKRLYNDYGPEGMKAVARIYFQMGHPFIRYWVD